ncbi:MAG: type VI secretion system-associated FHA domain protein TagH [Gammaproteobacteria bacterium]|nr:type VI secretion system-associated FHA domain protein TagH [Gammaproteobacteria bacterium]MCW8988430.1 type VI secretion system-associated FHA domain protein TagH [Gammaproteobacteria bacterium]
MSIVISITKLPDGVADTKSTHTFAHQGGTIGRGADNDWVIHDADCFISSQHSQITFEHGQFYITDLSTNGTFSNGSAEPIGKGNTIKLNDGDKFSLGDYEFLASVWQPDMQPGQSSAVNQGPFSNPVSPAEQPVIQHVEPVVSQDYFSTAQSMASDGFASSFAGHVSGAESLFSPEPIQTDPLAALDNARHIPETNSFGNNIFSSASQSDQADPMQQAVSWPESTLEAGAIPEDWESDIFGVPAKNNIQPDFSVPASHSNSQAIDKKSALEKANEKILAEIEILKKQAQRQALKEQIEKNTQSQTITTDKQESITLPKRNASSNEQFLIEALGLGKHDLSDEKVIEINQIVGELVRETITGMMQVLSSRSTIKNEFRMNVTTIQPVENNPLKFSATVDDAIENMFLKDGNSYKKPVEAIKEGFEGIAEHQIAILSGIRTAFKGVLTRFDPAVLEKRFEKFNKPGLIPGMAKLKNWDSYSHYYNELVDDMDNSFQHLFGYEFVQAYEEQLQQLMVARKTKN